MKSNDLPVGALIDTLFSIREERRELSAKDKLLEEQYKDLEEKIRARLDAEGMDKASSKKATISLGKPTIVATIKDWDALCKWVKKTGHFQVFQRRISDPAYRELLDLKKADVPGLEPFEKRTLNLRALSETV